MNISWPIHIPKVLLKNYSCGPDNEIESPGPSREYSGWTNAVGDVGLMNLYKMNPFVFP